MSWAAPPKVLSLFPAGNLVSGPGCVPAALPSLPGHHARPWSLGTGQGQERNSRGLGEGVAQAQILKWTQGRPQNGETRPSPGFRALQVTLVSHNLLAKPGSSGQRGMIRDIPRIRSPHSWQLHPAPVESLRNVGVGLCRGGPPRLQTQAPTCSRVTSF